MAQFMGINAVQGIFVLVHLPRFYLVRYGKMPAPHGIVT
jgi:hypothetical protein